MRAKGVLRIPFTLEWQWFRTEQMNYFIIGGGNRKLSPFNLPLGCVLRALLMFVLLLFNLYGVRRFVSLMATVPNQRHSGIFADGLVGLTSVWPNETALPQHSLSLLQSSSPSSPTTKMSRWVLHCFLNVTRLYILWPSQLFWSRQ